MSNVCLFFTQMGGTLLFMIETMVKHNVAGVHRLASLNKACHNVAKVCKRLDYQAGMFAVAVDGATSFRHRNDGLFYRSFKSEFEWTEHYNTPDGSLTCHVQNGPHPFYALRYSTLVRLVVSEEAIRLETMTDMLGDLPDKLPWPDEKVDDQLKITSINYNVYKQWFVKVSFDRPVFDVIHTKYDVAYVYKQIVRRITRFWRPSFDLPGWIFGKRKLL